SVVLTFKDQFHRAVAFTPSAAEKRDYETQPQLRQAPQQNLLQNFFLRTRCTLKQFCALAGCGGRI
ncbi:hypothetical protein, partial [Azonexus sp. R2A61]|uniref:hypothetical protein n=1 Tax=Azonexus sp. R2A61 TaxID=2744443 RepID=UPI001F286771